MGYTFHSEGRGEGYRITVTGLPEPPTLFEQFARREFGCGPQTNFKAMREHLFLLLNDPEYQFLPSNHQAKFLKEKYGITISDQSLRNWQNELVKRNWVAVDREKVKYYLCRKGEPPKEITEKEYTDLWHKYFSLTENKVDRSTALHIIYGEGGGMPRKQCGLSENALEREKLEELRRVLERSE